MLFEDIPARPTFTLYNLSLSLQSSVKTSFPGTMWVIAEISSIGVNSGSGHCYLELVDVDPITHQQRAKMRATIWARHTARVFQAFQQVAGVALQAGLTVQVLASLEYSPIYGLSLNITEIDGAYTAGALAVKRQQTLAQLARDGVLEMNRSLARPALPRRVAVVSSPTAAGYEDFMKQIAGAKERFSLKIELFDAVMQGEQAPRTIVDALGRVFQSQAAWDVVVIIRGGGARLDLSCFDDYTLASHVAQFPLPIYAGIGHERDSSVVDVVANASLKTPTAVAEFVKGFFEEREQALMGTVRELTQGMRTALDGNRVVLGQQSLHVFEGARRQLGVRTVEVSSIARLIALSFDKTLQICQRALDSECDRTARGIERAMGMFRQEESKVLRDVSVGAARSLSASREQLGVLSERLLNLRPGLTLARGYVRVERASGGAVRRSVEAKAGEAVRLRWADGERTAQIE